MPDFITVPTPDGDMLTHVALPSGDGPFPVVVLLQEAFGVTDNLVDIAGRLARDGFAAVAPELYHRSGGRIVGAYDDMGSITPHAVALTDGGIVSDLTAVIGWIGQQPMLDATRVTTMGFCLGGRAAFLAAVSLPIVASISFYGSGIVTTLDAWGLNSLLGRVAEMRCPVLFCFGLLDPTIPPEDIEKLRAALLAEGKREGADFEIAAYENANHGFFCDARESYQADAAADAWHRSLRWLRRATSTPVGTDARR
ncbi:MAG TPA: dienelactone hydrolase family protein [Candidatus Dormibacteraeota bacterium]|nr:dienelactone hydrolase family protein [Candidatus Dormibacteraeota bacterium]